MPESPVIPSITFPPNAGWAVYRLLETYSSKYRAAQTRVDGNVMRGVQPPFRPYLQAGASQVRVLSESISSGVRTLVTETTIEVDMAPAWSQGHLAYPHPETPWSAGQPSTATVLAEALASEVGRVNEYSGLITAATASPRTPREARGTLTAFTVTVTWTSQTTSATTPFALVGQWFSLNG